MGASGEDMSADLRHDMKEGFWVLFFIIKIEKVRDKGNTYIWVSFDDRLKAKTGYPGKVFTTFQLAYFVKC